MNPLRLSLPDAEGVPWLETLEGNRGLWTPPTLPEGPTTRGAPLPLEDPSKDGPSLRRNPLGTDRSGRTCSEAQE